MDLIPCYKGLHVYCDARRFVEFVFHIMEQKTSHSKQLPTTALSQNHPIPLTSKSRNSTPCCTRILHQILNSL